MMLRLTLYMVCGALTVAAFECHWYIPSIVGYLKVPNGRDYVDPANPEKKLSCGVLAIAGAPDKHECRYSGPGSFIGQEWPNGVVVCQEHTNPAEHITGICMITIADSPNPKAQMQDHTLKVGEILPGCIGKHCMVLTCSDAAMYNGYDYKAYLLQRQVCRIVEITGDSAPVLHNDVVPGQPLVTKCHFDSPK